MTLKEKFLQENVGFHFNELSLIRRAELQTICDTLKVSKDWMMLALSRKSLQEWEDWGFNLFRNVEFRQTIDGLLSAINKMDEQAFKKEKIRQQKGKPQVWVSPTTFQRVWDGVKAQGGLITHEEAEVRGLTSYWGINDYASNRSYLSLLAAQEEAPVDDEDMVLFAAGVVHYNASL